MAKLNKNIISPVLEHGNGYVFNVAGQNFKIVGSHIDMFNEANADFNSFESELSNGHLEMAQKGPGRLGAQQAHLNSLL